MQAGWLASAELRMGLLVTQLVILTDDCLSQRQRAPAWPQANRPLLSPACWN